MITKRKTSIMAISIALICAFVISSSSVMNVSAAEPPPELVGVGFNDNYELTDIPISIIIEFTWTENTFQKMYWVRLYYNINDPTVDLQYFLEYEWNGLSGEANKRPTLITLTFTASHYLEEGDTVYFKIGYEWGGNVGSHYNDFPTKLYKFKIRQDGFVEAQETRNMWLYIAAGVAVVVIVLTYILVKRRRR